MNLKYTKLVIERSRFAARQYDKNLANEAERELAAMQARIDTLTEYPERLRKAITELEKLKMSSPDFAQAERARMAGKIEGLKIALGYFEETNR